MMSRAQKKVAAIERYKKRLEQRLEFIDWELDVLLPTLDHVRELESSNSVEVKPDELHPGDEAA